MKAFAKIAVSIPADTLRSLERLRRKQGRSRSAAVTEAIEHWLYAQEMGEAERRYVDGYLRQPERIDEAWSTATAVARMRKR